MVGGMLHFQHFPKSWGEEGGKSRQQNNTISFISSGKQNKKSGNNMRQGQREYENER